MGGLGYELGSAARNAAAAAALADPIHALLRYLAENLAALPMRLVIAVPIAALTTLLLGPEVWVNDPVQLAIVPLSLLGAFLLTFLPMAIIGTLSLWWESLLVSLFEAARWPSSVFRGALAIVFTFVIPLALLTTYPALALLGKAGMRHLATAVCVALALFGISRWVWKRAIRSYAGASS